MKICRCIASFVIVGVVSTGCATRYVYHGESKVLDSAGAPIDVSLYKTETHRPLWFDGQGQVIWLITKDRPNGRIQFDKVDGVEPLAAEKRPTDQLVIQDSGYPGSVAGVISSHQTICSFTGGQARVQIFTKYKATGMEAPSFNQAYIAPRENAYPFTIEKQKLKDETVPDWVRDSVEAK